jgi:ribosomal protein S18 acetylase RimI-like enzyme
VSVDIRLLAPDRLEDYLAFFDTDAFADFPWWSACYCRFWDDRTDVDGDSSAQHRDRYRALVTELVRNGQQQGLLAYSDGKVVGWCNAKARLGYTMPRRIEKAPADDAARVGSIVCFIVAKDFRGRGLASAMLGAACEKFRGEGLAIVEAYPTTAAPSGPYADQIPWSAHNHTGPLEMYRKAGFTVHHQLERFAVVRKAL